MLCMMCVATAIVSLDSELRSEILIFYGPWECQNTPSMKAGISGLRQAIADEINNGSCVQERVKDLVVLSKDCPDSLEDFPALQDFPAFRLWRLLKNLMTSQPLLLMS